MSQKKQKAQFLHLLFSIVIPSIILMKFSSAESLGVLGGFLLALSFPLLYGVYDFIKEKKADIITILGLVSVILTGGIGVLKLNPEWVAVKEAAIPLIIGVAVILSIKTKYPLIRTLIYNDAVIDVKKVDAELKKHHKQSEFEKHMERGSYFLGASFFVSAILNYVLAKIIVVSPAGTEAFNQELGRMTALSFPVIALPMMIITMAISFFLFRGIMKMSGLSLMEIFHSQ